MTIKEQAELVRLLKQLEPGFYPIEIFWEFCRLNKLTVFEFLPYIKDKDGETKLLLTKRPIDDRFWPDMFHNPGCIVRQGDNIQDVFKRLVEGELDGAKVIGEPEFIETRFVKVKRGDSLAWYYKIEVESFDERWKPFTYNEIINSEDTTILEDLDIIKKAIFTSKVD